MHFDLYFRFNELFEKNSWTELKVNNRVLSSEGPSEAVKVIFLRFNEVFVHETGIARKLWTTAIHKFAPLWFIATHGHHAAVRDCTRSHGIASIAAITSSSTDQIL